jgi:hypothetical protein
VAAELFGQKSQEVGDVGLELNWYVGWTGFPIRPNEELFQVVFGAKVIWVYRSHWNWPATH